MRVELRLRVWIVRYEGWLPAGPHDVPQRAVALEPAENEPMSPAEADGYAQAFNRAMLAGRRKLWAVPLPVEARYDGDPRPGETLQLRGGPSRGLLRKMRAARRQAAHEKSPPCASQASAQDGPPPREKT